jgi:EmrB/QacA subfamily drug resistance transporter
MTRSERLVLAIAVLASFVAFLDGTVVNVALPAIVDELGGGLTTQQWTVDAYLVTLGSLILVAGSLSDAFGRIRILRIGLVLFGVASIAIAAAPDPLFLILARGVQGVAGALLVPSSLALITSTFDGTARGRAIGIWTGLTSVAMIVGPLIGGVFVDLASWRFAFLINVVPIAVTLVLLALLGQKDATKPSTRIDYLGAVLCTLGLGGPVFALIEQGRLGWAHPAIFLSMGLGMLAFAGFLVRQRFAAMPILPLPLFGVRNFWTGNVATAFIYGALGLIGLVVGVFLQERAGLSATFAGLAALPSTLLMILFSSRVGALAGRFGARVFMTVGPLAAAAGILLYLLVRPAPDFDYWWQALPAVLVFGAGLTLTVSPLTAAILGSIEHTRAGTASAVNNAVARVAGLALTAMIGIIAGGELDLDGFQRTIVVAAALMGAGGVVSFFGIRDQLAAESVSSG